MVLVGAAAAWCALVVLASGADAGVAPTVGGPVTGAGSWRQAIAVPGLEILNTGGSAEVNSPSCVSTGNCAAGGFYRDGSHFFHAFVVSERNGSWRMAIEVPGSGALNAGGNAAVNSVSCPSAGNCAAGGNYTDGSGHDQAFVVSEKNGRWGKAIEVPGSAALNVSHAQLLSVSCASAGNCAAGGSYTDGSGHTQVFVVAQKNGRWQDRVASLLGGLWRSQ